MPRLLLTTQTPLSLRDSRSQEGSSSLNYIPGGVMLGALAAAHARLRPTRRDEFADFFLRDQVCFGNLYPAAFKHEDLTDDAEPVYPLPRTARTCKRFSGFRFGAAAEREERHGGFDDLIAWAIFVLSDRQETTLLDQSQACHSPDCSAATDQARGYYRRGFEPEQIGEAHTAPGMRTRTGISRTTGAVAQGILYNRQIIPQDRPFWGTLLVDAEDIDMALRAFIDEAVAAGLVRVGNNRSRGFGRVAIQTRSFGVEAAEEIAERARAFDARLRTRAGQLALPHAFYLPITLTSDTLLYDRLLRHQLTLTGAYLDTVWNIPGAELVYQNAGRERVAGWHDVWGLPRADEWGIARGSVFLFGLPGEPDFARLAQMQARGIGARRSEGFGQVRIADTFHQEVKPL
jgi:CRISPR-associated protein Csx10